MTKYHKSVIIGILWIFSGPLLLIMVVLLNVLLHFVFKQNDSSIAPIVNILSWLLGAVGLLLVLAGPIIGVIFLSKKSE